jgi:hypothetical protein
MVGRVVTDPSLSIPSPYKMVPRVLILVTPVVGIPVTIIVVRSHKVGRLFQSCFIVSQVSHPELTFF